RDAAALDVLSPILGSGATSRLYRPLGVDQRAHTHTGSFYQGTSLDLTRFGVYATPEPGITFPQVERALDDVIAEVVKNGVTDDELASAKTRMIADAVYAQDNQATLARWFGVALTTGSTVDDVRAWPDRVRAVTADRVREAAKTWLDMRRSVTGYLVKELPKEKQS